MMPVRPRSIVQFDRIYLAIIALGLVGVAAGWNDMMATVQVQQTIARFGMAMVYLPLVVGIIIQLLLWYFVAKRGSLIAKWIFVVLTGIGIAWSAFGIVTGSGPGGVAAIIDVATIVLQVVAIMLLFRPDTAPWFGETVPAA